MAVLGVVAAYVASLVKGVIRNLNFEATANDEMKCGVEYSTVQYDEFTKHGGKGK